MNHTTKNLAAYPIPDSILTLLRKVDGIAQMVARRGGSVPATIALSHDDFARVDMVVRAYSDGKLNAHDVHFNGRPITVPSRDLIAA